ncbi:TonB-dependent siderophore receptor, partial [Pseudomonas syringae pv. actinidiae ICMP 19096]
QISASAAAIRARVEGSGTEAYEGHQALNVPEYRATLQADYSLPIRGLALLGGVQYSASKYADRTGSVQVNDYALFNIG